MTELSPADRISILDVKLENNRLMMDMQVKRRDEAIAAIRRISASNAEILEEQLKIARAKP